MSCVKCQIKYIQIRVVLTVYYDALSIWSTQVIQINQIFLKDQALPPLQSTDFFSSHTLRICFKIQGVKTTPHLICPLPVSWCIVDSWQTCEELLQCSRSDFFRLFSEILGQSSFPVYSFGVLYWAHGQSTRVTCRRAQSSMRNSWCIFMLSPSPQGDECAQLNIFLWNYFKYCANKRESRIKEMCLLFIV